MEQRGAVQQFQVAGGRITRRAAFLLAASAPAAFPAEARNARWSFLQTNLSVFPGTEQIFAPDDNLFWRLKSGLRGARCAERIGDQEWPFHVSTDAEGRRLAGDAVEVRRTALFLGDSCTFGIPVDDAESFPAQCQALLPGLRSVNAGVPGYSAFQGRLLLEAIGPALEPDAVVMTFWVNDRTVWDHLSDPEHHELLAAERAGEMSRHRVTRLLRRVTPGDRPRLTEEEFAAEIRAMTALCRRIGARPVMVVWPSAPQMDGGPPHARQALLAELARAESIHAVELAPAFRRHGGRSLFVDPVHATREGYRVAAAEVARALEP